jgi:hypothetical protein
MGRIPSQDELPIPSIYGDRAMMNGGWGWGMGGLGRGGILTILVVVGIAIVLFRRSNS